MTVVLRKIMKKYWYEFDNFIIHLELAALLKRPVK